MTAAKKFAISVPPDVMRQVDRAARARGWTRSRFIASVLRVAAQKLTDAEIARAVDELFSDPELAAEQSETARAFQRASKRAAEPSVPMLRVDVCPVAR
jgi:metal-responsive CopG/Arc/MetJ family transcriptional regulator